MLAITGRLPFCCVKTVSERQPLRVPGLLSSEEQIPQIVVKIRNWRQTMESLEGITLLDTHTAVEAGFDRFPVELMRTHFDWDGAQRLGISFEELMALGRRNPADPEESFNISYPANRASCLRRKTNSASRAARGTWITSRYGALARKRNYWIVHSAVGQ